MRLGRVKPAVLAGAVCVAVLVVVVMGVGAAQPLTTDGFVVVKGEEASSSAGASADVSAVEPAAAAQLCVFVSGAVVNPGIYYLDEGARVTDAVAAANGFASDAATDALNLARTLVDGEQIAVPSQEALETASAAVMQSATSSVAGASAGVPSTIGGRVNINTADAAALQTLNGIGEATARKIVADREANGPYKTIEDLKRVSGIGDKKFEGLRDSICV